MFRYPIAGSIASVLSYGAQTFAAMDPTNKKMGERAEEMLAKLINEDPNVEILINRILYKFRLEGGLMVVPVFDDTSMLIQKYALVWVTRANKPVLIAEKADLETMLDFLTVICTTQDKVMIDTFLLSFKA